MKKLITLGFAAIAAGMTFAAANDVLITFSTPGPDTYADGATVLDGECYALCWSKDFSQFAIKPDGTAEGGSIVLKVPAAKGGRCPTIVFEIDADYAASNYAGGEWAVYLLDTRKFGENGAASLTSGATKVNTVGKVGSVSVGTGTAALLTGTVATALEPTGEVAKPEITGIRVVGGYVYITVKGAPYLGYGLTSGDAPDSVVSDVEGARASATGEEEITIITGAKSGGEFFKVRQK